MSRRIVLSPGILLPLILAAALLAGCGGASVSAAPAIATPAAPLDGKTLMQQRCGVCHGLGRVTNSYGTAADWKGAVDQMIMMGAQLTPAEEQVLVAYLAQTYHP
jgi:cytochrome c5